MRLTRISLYRIVRIVVFSVRVFLQVWWFGRVHRRPWSTSTQAAFEQMAARQAADYRRLALHLQGLMIKFGQFLSTRADLMPTSFLQELESLVDQVPPVPWEQVKPILDEEWGGHYGDVLHKISVAPVASASIGVVYHGYLHTGESVAVKVRRPGIEQVVRADFRALRIVLWLARRFTALNKRADLRSLYREMTSIIGDELDFNKELANGQYFARKYQGEKQIAIPRFYEEYSSVRVLVMEWIEGARITDLDFIEKNGLDRHEIATRLVACFTDQFFSGGKFHADPHPGNLLLKPDGTLTLIDFGMVGTVRKEDATHIRELIEAIILEDADKVIEALEQLRFLLPTADRSALQDAILSLIRLYTGEGPLLLDEAALERILTDIQETVKHQPIQLPSEFAFLGRALSTLVGVLHILDPGIDLSALTRPIVRDWVRRHGPQDEQDAVQSSLLRLAREWAAPLLRYPRLVEQSLRAKGDQAQFERERFVAQQALRVAAQRAIAFYLVFLLACGTLVLSIYTAHAPVAVAAGVVAVLAGCSAAWNSLAQGRIVRRLREEEAAWRMKR